MATTSMNDKRIKRIAQFVYGCVLVFIISPLLTLLFSDYLKLSQWQYIDWKKVETALLVSVKCVGISLVIILIGGTLSVYAILKTKGKYKKVLEQILYIPSMMPPAVMGILMLLTFGRNGSVGKLLAPMGITFTFSTWGVVLILVFIGFSFFIKGVLESIRQVDTEVFLSAMVEGCSEVEAFWKIGIPIARAGIGHTFLLTLSRLLAEFGATIMFAGNLEGKTQTMPLAIYTAMESNMSEALIMAAIMLGISIFLMLGISSLEKWRCE